MLTQSHCGLICGLSWLIKLTNVLEIKCEYGVIYQYCKAATYMQKHLQSIGLYNTDDSCLGNDCVSGDNDLAVCA